MNLNLFLIILIALIIIFFIILYNGIRILLTVGKEKGIVKYEFKVTILKIPIFKRIESKEIIESIKPKGKTEDLEEEKEEGEKTPESKENKSEEDKSEKGISDSQDEKPEGKKEDEKGLREKYAEFKPILNELKKSKEELKSFLNDILKSINLKKLEGHLILGLSNHTTTIKIASWIWSIGAIVNSKKPTLLTVEPRFTEVIMDFEGKIELKINLLLLIIYSLLLLTKKNIRDLIKELYRQKKSQDQEKTNKINEKDNEEEKVKEKFENIEKEETEDENKVKEKVQNIEKEETEDENSIYSTTD